MKPYPKTKKIKKASAKSLDKKLWPIFSEYIRRRDAKKFSGGDFVKCITCSHIAHWKELDCGHFVSRRHLATKYHEKNNAAQCKGCNGPGSGKQYEYGLEIDRRYGAGTAQWILQASRAQVKWGSWEFEVLIEDYKQKLKEL